MKSQVNALLLAGEYICPVRYPAEFRHLQAPVNFDRAKSFLGEMDMTLSRLGDDGAFFMSRLTLSSEDLKEVKNDFLNFRDKYGVTVLVLEQIRQTVGHVKALMPGELIAVYELEMAVNNSSVLATGMATLVNVVPHASQRNSHNENLRRTMEYLVKGGYAILTNKDTSSYQLTGKVAHLYQVLQYLNDHAQIPEEHVDDVSDADATVDMFAS